MADLPSLEEIIAWGGYLGLAAIVFTETGLLVGFFLPGDSLLVTAGLLIATGAVPMDAGTLIFILCVAAVLGDSTGYWIGARAGHALYNRPDSRWFKREHLLKTKEFYEKYGGITIVLARFIPLVRTFAPVVAGIGEMKYGKFLFYNIFGGVGWISSMILLGYYLAVSIPGIRDYIELVIAAVILVSFVPVIVKVVRERRKPSG